MLTRAITFLLVSIVALACGGAGPANPSGATFAPGQPTTGTQPTPAAPGPVTGEAVDGEVVANALTALHALDSWTFEQRFWTKGPDTGIEQSVSGTERRTPDVAVDAIHNQPTSSSGLRYIRIGDDIWTDFGTGDFLHNEAPDRPNLVNQYEPDYVAALIRAPSDAGLDYEPVGAETVNGMATNHYTLSETDREDVAQLWDVDPALWAGDVWLAADGGYLVVLAWGPQSVETAQSLQRSFRYEVTAVNCACPIEPPE